MLIAALKARKDLPIHTLSYLIIVPLFKNQFFSFLVKTNMFTNMKKKKKMYFALECIYLFLHILDLFREK